MKKLASLLLFLPLFSYGQGHYPLLGANDTADIPNSKTAGRDYYQSIPRPLQPSDKTYKSYVDSLNGQTEINLQDQSIRVGGFNYIGIDDRDTPLIVKTLSGDQRLMRELGPTNNKQSDTFYSYYSASDSPYVQNNVYTFRAISNDGMKNIASTTKIFNGDTTEDPFVVPEMYKGYYRGYAEDKSVSPSPGIRIYRSLDLNTWEFRGLITKNAALNWQNTDISSPSPFVKDDTLWMDFEARGSATGGAIGRRYSTDGETFTPYGTTPIITGTDMSVGSVLYWATHLVPDQTIKIGDRYYMFVHAWNGNYFAGALLGSSDYVHWIDEVGTWITGYNKKENLGEGVIPFLYNGKLFAMYGLGNSIFKGFFKQNPYSNSTMVTKTLATGIRGIKNASHDEIVQLKPATAINLDFNYQPGSYESTTVGMGFTKMIKNDTAFDVTIRPLGGVTIDNSTSNIPLSPGQSVIFTSKSTNDYFTFLKTNYYGYGLIKSHDTVILDSAISPTYNFLSANYFKQGGNSFGATGVLGTNDNNSLVFRTNNTDQWYMSTTGQLAWGAAPDERFQIWCPSGPNSFSFKQDGTHEFLSGWTWNADPTLSNAYLRTFGSNNKILIDGSQVILQTVSQANYVGIGVATALARLHLSAGSATRAPFMINHGPVLTTPLAGAIENDGTRPFYTNSSASRSGISLLSDRLTNTATLDFGNTSAQQSAELTITVTGAADGDVVSLGVPNGSSNANSCFTARVSATNTVTVKFNNYSSGAIDPASGSFKVMVFKN